MTRTYLARPRLTAIWKLSLVASMVALALALSSALIVRGAPTGSTSYACVNRYTGQMRFTFTNGQCSASEYQISWNSFTGADLDAEYVNEGQPDSITSAMIVDGQVMNSDLAADSITTDKILDGAVGVDDLGTGSVGSDEIVNGSIAQGDLDAGLQTWIDNQTLEGYEIRQSTTIGPRPDPIIGGITMHCLSTGQRVVGGGVNVSNPNSSRMVESYPVSSTSWKVAVTLAPGDVAYPYIICIGP